MIIVEDYIRRDEVLLKKVYSDKGVYIQEKSTGRQFEDAVNLNLTDEMFVETDIEIENYEEYEIPE